MRGAIRERISHFLRTYILYMYYILLHEKLKRTYIQEKLQGTGNSYLTYLILEQAPILEKILASELLTILVNFAR